MIRVLKPDSGPVGVEVVNMTAPLCSLLLDMYSVQLGRQVLTSGVG